ncbi:MAG: hypothetical protein ACLQDY_18425 [Streptosporangiaceae bacterium]
MNSLLTVGHDTVDERHVVATILVGDEDAADYLGPGQRFHLWQEGEAGYGLVTRRVFTGAYLSEQSRRQFPGRDCGHVGVRCSTTAAVLP